LGWQEPWQGSTKCVSILNKPRSGAARRVRAALRLF